MIIGQVLDTLYRSNQDSDTTQDVYKVARNVSLIEHHVSEA